MAASENGVVLIWELHQLECLAHLRHPRLHPHLHPHPHVRSGSVVMAVDSYAHGDMAVAYGDGLTVWDVNCDIISSVEMGKAAPPVNHRRCTALCFIPCDGIRGTIAYTALLSGHDNGCIILWNVFLHKESSPSPSPSPTPSPLSRWRMVATHVLSGAHTVPITCLSVTADASRMWSGDGDGFVCEWVLNKARQAQRSVHDAAAGCSRWFPTRSSAG